MTMNIIDRYIAKRVLLIFSLVMIILVLGLSLERLLRLVDEVTSSGAPLIQALYLLIYLQPHYWGSALPPALFLAVMITIRRLHEQHELVILHGAGHSLIRLCQSVFVLSLIGSTFLLILVAYIQPYSRYDYRVAYNAIKYNIEQVQLRPHVFQRLNDKLIIRIESVANTNPLTINGFFSSVKNREGGRTTISARKAVVSSQSKEKLSLLLSDGSIIKEKATGESNIIQFNEYVWSPTLDDSMNYGLRGSNRRELDLAELLAGGAQNVILENTPAERRAEIHSRLVAVLSIPVLAMLAIPMGLIGGNRGGKAYGIGLGIVVLVLYEKILGFGAAYASSGAVSPYFSLWAVWAALLIITAILLAYRNDYPRSITWGVYGANV